MVSAPGFAFASRIACRNEPSPLSSRLVTVKLLALTRFVPVVSAMPIHANTASATIATPLVTLVMIVLLKILVEDGFLGEVEPDSRLDHYFIRESAVCPINRRVSIWQDSL